MKVSNNLSSEVNTAIFSNFPNVSFKEENLIINSIKYIIKNQHLRLLDGINFKVLSNQHHIIFDYNRKQLILHNEKFFKNFMLKTTFLDNDIHKIYKLNGYTILFIFRGNKTNFKAEGIMEIFSNINYYIYLFKDSISKIGDDQFKAWLLDLLALVMDFTAVGLTVSRLVAMFGRAISIILRFCDYIKGVKSEYKSKGFLGAWRSESFGDIAFILSAFGLSKEFVDKVTLFQKLATLKLNSLDFVIDAFCSFINLIIYLLNELYVKYKFEILLNIKELISECFGFVIHVDVTKQLTRLYEKYCKDPQIMFSAIYRKEVLEVEEKIQSVDYKKYIMNNIENKHLYNIYQAFLNNIVKYAKTFTTTSRQEPVCFMLEGPAGCGKSRLMNLYTSYLKNNRSVYTHSVPAIVDSKDFYDDYENHEVFVVDDVGQQGLSQWRNIINWVSPVKYPLPCASAEKKNTKFFNSKLILGTTNLFTQINGFTDNDCISTPEALFRRVHVIKCDPYILNGKVVGYDLNYNKYDYRNTKMFVSKFIDENENLKGIPTHIRTKSDEEALKWLHTIVYNCEKNNKISFDNADITENTISALDEIEKMDINVDQPDFSHIQYVDNAPNGYDNYESESLFDYGKLLTDIGYMTPFYALNIFMFDIFMYSFQVSYSKLLQYCIELIKPYLTNIMELWKNTDGIFKLLICSVVIGGLCLYFVDKCESYEKSLVKDMKIAFKNYDGKIFNSCYTSVSLETGKKEYFIKNEKGEYETVYPFRPEGYENVNKLEFINNYYSQTYLCEVFSQDKEGNTIRQVVHSTFSGMYGFTVAHAFHLGIGPLYINVYKSWEDYENKKAMLNQQPVTIIKTYEGMDIVIFKLNYLTVAPFKKRSVFSSHTPLAYGQELYFLNSNVKAPMMMNHNIGLLDSAAVYKTQTIDRTVFEGFKYDISGMGLCGSLIVSSDRVHGMHVCGNGSNGVAMMLPTKILNDINYFFNLGNIIKYEQKEVKVENNFSGMRFFQDDLKTSNVPAKSNIIPSVLNNISTDLSKQKEEFITAFEEEINLKVPEVQKLPANLSAFGNKTLSTLSKKSFKHIPNIDNEEIEFAKKCLDTLLIDFSPIVDDLEVAFGNDDLTRLNKDSVNGYGYHKDKKEYLDYDNKIIKPNFYQKLDEFKKKCLNDELEISDILQVESLKDELRPEEKANKPRCFRILPLHHTFLLKKYIGNLSVHINKNRWLNGISIGMNPYTDWDNFYNLLAHVVNSDGIVFDGDFGSYDGSAPPRLQDAIMEVVLNRFRGSEEEKKIFSVLLESIIRSYVLVKEELYMTTHSLPSGCWVTALFNSFLNRMITAICLYRHYKLEHKTSPSVSDWQSILDFVLGDDKVVGANKEMKNYVNAITMKATAESFGMTYTDALKGEITEPSKPLMHIQFLKRMFVFNRDLQKVVGVLDFNTIIQSLRYIDRTKNYDEVIQGKLTAAQFELMLYNNSEDYINSILNYARMNGIPARIFSKEEIYKSMLTDPLLYNKVCQNLFKYNHLCN
jgi:hypothetical protein